MDSNYRFPVAKEMELVRKPEPSRRRQKCASKRKLIFQVPMVRIHLPPAASQQRTVQWLRRALVGAEPRSREREPNPRKRSGALLWPAQSPRTQPGRHEGRAPRLPVEPDVFHAPIVDYAVDHHCPPLHLRLPAVREAVVKDDRPRTILR